ncbi:hypothetical protein FT663_02535 [Candidozyma haemuli var. vulneris]|uniref:Mitochondrial intermediate peptidase n=1 Tax=Candidozyma haemuli TaxID=45357 RepID=A0A2V1AMR8_9ASCO|nr:hypothetical protein CXQ85_001380 [[Candida] haemuloni]KAF3989709.1 hypothetical protein FT662_02684 [[Candida] haemuloni var. vulneris]KAF3991913.1 hypothetical protein FT663_02535 [[Candida] haemuloni var. vulneris]PVH19085.1 hypothetical protein CXQ85_001380 [[Candida] haemuloni]
MFASSVQLRSLPKLALTRAISSSVAIRKPIQGDQLTRLFDSQKCFSNFNKAPGGYFSTKHVGLFRNEKLKSPDGLIEFSKESLKKAKSLVKTMLLEAKNTDQGKLSYIRKLDQLSDILCRVIDAAEFIRVVHPSQKWVAAAQNTHEIMFEYMNQLNTNVDLYRTLAQILDSDIVHHLSQEEIDVGKYLRQDFERSGIAMDPETRNNFVAITQQISLLGASYNNEVHDLESFWCTISPQEFELIGDERLKSEIKDFQAKAPRTNHGISIPLAGSLPYSILVRCSNEEVRRKVWIALHNSPKRQIKTLDSFVKYRALLANMLGYSSFADYQLEHKMAKSPHNVIAFLTNLQETLLSEKKGVMSELRRLYKYKNGSGLAVSNDEVLSEVKPWDRDYLLAKMMKDSDLSSHDEEISEYLSVGTVMNGLSKLFQSIYNVSLVPERTDKGETWDHSSVRKLKYMDLTNNEVLGYLYVDFWSEKVLPSHFTIVCSRELNTSIGTESREDMEQAVHLSKDKDYQLPVISLVCNFQKPKSTGMGRLAGLDSDMPTLLTLEQVDTIFHEMGHAMHSMLGRTRLHNLSGTRCSTDFVELPSVLMESFSNDPRVLCKIAKHYKTGESLPESLLRNHQAKRDSLKHCESYMQSKMALLDQVLHDEKVVDFSNHESFKKFSSTSVYHHLEGELKVFADQWSTWHGKFPHLFSYGAVYYSYLLDRAIAEKVWNGLFKDDPWSRAAGEKYKESILKWGGARDPWKCLAEALDDEELSKGDARAMEIIGHL